MRPNPEEMGGLSDKDKEMMGIKVEKPEDGYDAKNGAVDAEKPASQPEELIITEKGKRFVPTSREDLQAEMKEMREIATRNRDVAFQSENRATMMRNSGAEVPYIKTLQKLEAQLGTASTPEELRAIQLQYHEANDRREADLQKI